MVEIPPIHYDVHTTIKVANSCKLWTEDQSDFAGRPTILRRFPKLTIIIRISNPKTKTTLPIVLAWNTVHSNACCNLPMSDVPIGHSLAGILSESGHLSPTNESMQFA
jgi:hypothetical protein